LSTLKGLETGANFLQIDRNQVELIKKLIKKIPLTFCFIYYSKIHFCSPIILLLIFVTGEPSGQPTNKPSGEPTGEPSGQPTTTSESSGSQLNNPPKERPKEQQKNRFWKSSSTDKDADTK
jgi:hypothetical protein